jgi:hypothetical protein
MIPGQPDRGEIYWVSPKWYILIIIPRGEKNQFVSPGIHRISLIQVLPVMTPTYLLLTLPNCQVFTRYDFINCCSQWNAHIWPFLRNNGFSKFSAKISMSFDAPREINPHSVSPHHWGVRGWDRQTKQKAQKTEMGIDLSNDADCDPVNPIFYGVFLEFSSHFFWAGCEGQCVFTNPRRTL